MGSRRHVVVSVAASLALLAALSACSSKSSSPTGPGGGGTPNPPAPFDLGPFGVSRSIALTFPNAGTFGYHCRPHAASMTGTVTVNASGDDSAVVSVGPGSTLTFQPASVTVKPGGYVRWVNVNSTMTIHTVTSD